MNIKEFNGDIGCGCCCCCLDGKVLLLLFKPPKVDDGYMPIKTRFISSPEHCMTSTKHFLLAKKKHLPFLCIDAFMAESSPSHCIKHSPEGKPLKSFQLDYDDLSNNTAVLENIYLEHLKSCEHLDALYVANERPKTPIFARRHNSMVNFSSEYNLSYYSPTTFRAVVQAKGIRRRRLAADNCGFLLRMLEKDHDRIWDLESV